MANADTGLLVTISKPIYDLSNKDSSGSEPFQKAISSLQAGESSIEIDLLNDSDDNF